MTATYHSDKGFRAVRRGRRRFLRLAPLTNRVRRPTAKTGARPVIELRPRAGHIPADYTETVAQFLDQRRP